MKNSRRSSKSSSKNDFTMEINKICRLCAREGERCKDILQNEQTQAIEIIQKFFGISITSTDTFHYLCFRCDEKLLDLNRFNQEIEDAQIYLNSLNSSEENMIVPVDIKPEPVEDREYFVKDEPITKQDSETDDSQQDLFPMNATDDSNDYKSDLDELSNDVPNRIKKSSMKMPKMADRDKKINEFFEFNCAKCLIQFENWRSYKQHLLEHHSDTHSPIITCCSMELQLERRHLLAHVEYHQNPEDLKCKLCDKQFLTADNKKKHEWRHKVAIQRTGKQESNQKVPCSVCGKILADKGSYRKHMQLHMTDEEREKLKAQCDYCKKFFRDKNTILIHIKDAHLPRHESISCDQCAKIFSSSRTFSIHYKNQHSGDNRVVCPDCGVEMKSYNLRKHQKMKHDTVAQTCPLCFKEFRNRVSLMIHRRRVHIEPKFACDVCGKMFKVKSKWKEHRETHFTSNRFSCDQCEYINNDYANMLKHRKTKHQDAPPILPGTGRKIFEAR